MDQNEFRREQAAAAERMRRMYERSQVNSGGHTMPPTPDFVRVGAKDSGRVAPQMTPREEEKTKNAQPAAAQNSNEVYKKAPNGNGLPFFGDGFFADKLREPDTALILGLILLLFSENADRRLLFALLYILM